MVITFNVISNRPALSGVNRLLHVTEPYCDDLYKIVIYNNVLCNVLLWLYYITRVFTKVLDLKIQ